MSNVFKSPDFLGHCLERAVSWTTRRTGLTRVRIVAVLNSIPDDSIYFWTPPFLECFGAGGIPDFYVAVQHNEG